MVQWAMTSTRRLPADDNLADVAPPANRSPRLSRRAVFLGAFSVVGLGAVAAGGAVWGRARQAGQAAVEAVRQKVRLPAPGGAVPIVPAPATPAVLSGRPAITPTADFFLIDNAAIRPVVDVSSWSLSIGGRVSRPFTLNYEQLLALPSIERVVTLACVSNGVGGDLAGSATWQGVRLTDLLDRAGIGAGASMLVGTSTDGFIAGFPLAVAQDGRDAMVAFAMNGEPLTVNHGFPARLVVPGLYGYVSATKWLTSIKLASAGEAVPYWVGQGWSADGTVLASSRIDVPKAGARVSPGPVVVAGRAWHQHVGVKAVQVRVDGGAWAPAELADSLGVDSWRLWTFAWTATPGRHNLTVRMISEDGVKQTGTAQPYFPGAATGWHKIEVDVK